jgi:ferric-dicitrate binding protein FerR (iron transport regulator)
MTMLKQEEIEKIERYINRLSDDKEEAFVESLFSNGGENNSLLRHQLEKDWDLMLRESSPVDINLDHVLDHVHHIIRKKETLKRQEPLQKFIRVYMKAAAILLIPFLITGGLVYNYLNFHSKSSTDQQVSSTIYAPLGARVSFNLPDGTHGMLNSDSRMTYTLPFNNNRNIDLEGEAWFEVNHDKGHPFEISAGNSKVKVLGTSFNVSAYQSQNYIEVVLQKGKIEFRDNKGDKKVTLLPSERLVFQNGNISKSVTDPEKYYAWTEGKLVFRSDPMAEVARRIERWYNVKVELANQELEKYSFRATFEDDKLEDVLRFLSMTSPINYKITPNELMSDGTYKKEVVTIYLNE